MAAAYKDITLEIGSQAILEFQFPTGTDFSGYTTGTFGLVKIEDDSAVANTTTVAIEPDGGEGAIAGLIRATVTVNDSYSDIDDPYGQGGYAHAYSIKLDGWTAVRGKVALVKVA